MRSLHLDLHRVPGVSFPPSASTDSCAAQDSLLTCGHSYVFIEFITSEYESCHIACHCASTAPPSLLRAGISQRYPISLFDAPLCPWLGAMRLQSLWAPLKLCREYRKQALSRHVLCGLPSAVLCSSVLADCDRRLQYPDSVGFASLVQPQPAVSPSTC